MTTAELCQAVEEAHATFSVNANEEENQLTWRSWWDGDGSLQRRWNVEALPTLFLIDHEGMVRYRFVGGGPTTEENVENAIKDLLRKVPDGK